MAELARIPEGRLGRQGAPGVDERLEPASGSGATPLQIALRHRWRILAFAVLMTVLVGVWVKHLPVRYDASASVMIDLRQPRVSSGESLLASQPVDLDLLRTYMEALRSPGLAVDVVRTIGSARLGEFAPKPPGWLAATLGRLVHPTGAPATSPKSAARCGTPESCLARQVRSAVSFSNDGRSYIISITATAGNADLAAQIANHYAGAFIARRREERAGLTDRADAWLTGHLSQLRGDVVAADTAMQKLREGGHLTSLNGQTLLAQSLSEVNAQLVAASGDLAQKQGTLRELEQAARPGARGLDSSAALLSSPIIQGLIEREGALAASQAELSTRLGTANSTMVSNRAELTGVREQLRTQLGKAQASVRGEVEALQARVSVLQESVRDLQVQLGAQGKDDTRLQNLERDALAARKRYDEAEQRLEQIKVDSAMQRADVQLVVEAEAPDMPSFPRTRMILTGTFIAMLAVGTAIATAMEMLSRVFGTAEQVEEQTGLHVLGLFPAAARIHGRRLPWQKEGAATQPDRPAPDSREEEALQAVFAGLIGGRRDNEAAGQVMMVTSALPGEGKTSFAVGLGRAAAARGLSVVVLDCDLRRSTMRRHFPQLDRPGQELVPAGEGAALGFVTAAREASGLEVRIAQRNGCSPHAFLASDALPRTLQTLRATHDVIILDTPPILAVPDVLSVAPLVDNAVMLVAWRQTPRSAVQAALRALRRAETRLSGIVLSKVDLARFARGHAGSSYYAKLYPAYHASGSA